MKLKNICYTLSLLFIISCADPGGDRPFDGFSFFVPNKTNESYTGKIIIGGVKDNLFIPTDSIESLRKCEPEIASCFNEFINENRWKPDLDKIRNIPSERCYFKLKLSNGREEILVVYNSAELFNLKLPSTKNFVGGYGSMYINIFDTQIVGHVGERED